MLHVFGESNIMDECDFKKVIVVRRRRSKQEDEVDLSEKGVGRPVKSPYGERQ